MLSTHALRGLLRSNGFLAIIPIILVVGAVGIDTLFRAQQLIEPDAAASYFSVAPAMLPQIHTAREPAFDKGFWQKRVNAYGDVEDAPLLNEIAPRSAATRREAGIVLRGRLASLSRIASTGPATSQSGQPSRTNRIRERDQLPKITIVDDTTAEMRIHYPETGNIIDVTVGDNGLPQFTPSVVSITAGDTVRWTWASDRHSVTSGDSCVANSQFCSPNDTNCPAGTTSGPGTVYQHTFSQPGSYSYFCATHCSIGMIGTVNVAPGCILAPSRLVAWWPGDGNVNALQGGNSMILQNGATFGPGEVGQGFLLDGNDDSLAVTQSPVTNSEITLDAWINPVTLSGRPVGPVVFEKGAQVEDRIGVQILDNGSLCGYLNSGVLSACSNPGVIATGQFSFVAITFNNATQTMKIYANGVLVAQTSGADTLHVANGPFLIGDSVTSGVYDNFEGTIDEIEMFDRALDAQELAAIYNAASAGKCKVPTPLDTVSRKTHGGAGDFDVNLPTATTPGVECRSGGATADHQMKLTFPQPVNVDGNPQAEVTSGNGTVGSGGVANGGGVAINGNVVTVPLTNVANAQTITVRLNTVNNGFISGNVSIPMSTLVGDSNGNRTVNAGDVAQTKSRIGQAVDATNFRSDVNANGVNNASDTAIVKANVGTAVP